MSKEAKSLRWLAINFPKVEQPAGFVERMQNCINDYCTAAADRLEQLEKDLETVTAAYRDALETIKQECGCYECKIAEERVCIGAFITNDCPRWQWRGREEQYNG